MHARRSTQLGAEVLKPSLNFWTMPAIALGALTAGYALVVAFDYFSGQSAPIETAATIPAVVRLTQPQANAPRFAPHDRVGLTREIQAQLKRSGCYDGPVNGLWTSSTRSAMASFLTAVNARLPVDQPDDVLLGTLAGQSGAACSAAGAIAQDKPMPPVIVEAAAVAAAVPSVAAARFTNNAPAAVSRLPSSADVLASVEPIDPRTTDANERPREVQSASVARDPGDEVIEQRPVRRAQRKIRSRQYQKLSKPPKFVKSFVRSMKKTFSSLGF